MKPHARKIALVVPTKIDGLRATWQYHCFAHRRTKDCTAQYINYSTTTTRVQRKASKTVGCFQGMLPSQPLGKSTKSVRPRKASKTVGCFQGMLPSQPLGKSTKSVRPRKASKTVGCFQGMLPSQPVGKSTKSVRPIQILRDYALRLPLPSLSLLIFSCPSSAPPEPTPLILYFPRARKRYPSALRSSNLRLRLTRLREAPRETARTENDLGSTDKNRWLARHLAVPLLRTPADEGLHRSVHTLLYYYYKSTEESFKNSWVLSRHVAITTIRKIDEKCPSQESFRNGWVLSRHVAITTIRKIDEKCPSQESFKNGWVLSRHVAITTSRKIDEKCPSHSNIEGLCATPSSPFSLPSNFLLPIFRAARANPAHPLLPEGPKTLSIRSTLQQPPPTVDTTSRSST